MKFRRNKLILKEKEIGSDVKMKQKKRLEYKLKLKIFRNQDLKVKPSN